ncbi:type II toxin-antitoxin system VapC family toxin [Merismopedia glauca]|nr:type II toxin-antitoxin system VapC family toxin [Merismopedia glauca]
MNSSDRISITHCAIALANQAVILTRNDRDFGQIEGLLIENWT